MTKENRLNISDKRSNSLATIYSDLNFLNVFSKTILNNEWKLLFKVVC